MKVDLGKCKLICEYVSRNDDMAIFVKEQIYRNTRGWLYIHYEGGANSCYGVKKGPFMFKHSQGTSRISKKNYFAWRESHSEFKDEHSWFIDFENEENEEKILEEAKKFCTYSRLLHSIDDVPF